MQSTKKPNIGSKWDDMMSILLKMDKFLQKFKNQNYTDLTTCDYIYESAEIRNILLKWIDSLGEKESFSTTITNAYRSKGNEMYKNVYTRGAEAIEYYTKAIFSAPKYSKELGLAHANRAAALIALDFYEEAYFDCEMAKQNSYPTENLLKVLLRQALCSAFLKNQQNLGRNIQDIEYHLKRYKIQTHATKVAEFKAELAKMKMAEPTQETVARIDNNSQMSQNKKIVEKISSSAGRYCIAGETIAINDAVMHEEAFAFVPVYKTIDPTVIDYNCQSCARTQVIPFPCYDCFGVTYCSPKCRESHVFGIHQYECAGYKLNLWLEIGIAHLALRTMVAGFLALLSKITHFRNVSVQTVLRSVFAAAESDDEHFEYGRVLRLVHNFNKMDKDDVLRYCLTAAMLTVYLKHCTTFFEDIPKEYSQIFSNSFDWEKLTTILLTLHMGQLVCNGHAISDLSLTQSTALNCLHSKDTVRLGMLHCYITSDRIFTAIFPRISIFNHSCDPNIRNRFNGRLLTVSATRSLSAGDEILNCYGPNYKLMRRADRQCALSQQYCFTCCCSRCSIGTVATDSQQEPYICQKATCGSMIFDEYPKRWWRTNDSLLPPPLIKCKMCGLCQNFDWTILFNGLIEQMRFSNSFGELCNQACDIYTRSVRFLSENHEQKLDMAMILLSQSVLLTGNERKFDLNKKLLKIAKDYLKQTEYRFGRISIEFVVASAFVLDLLAIRRKITENLEPEYDLDQIVTSIDVLSDTSKILFNKYIQNYILCN